MNWTEDGGPLRELKGLCFICKETLTYQEQSTEPYVRAKGRRETGWGQCPRVWTERKPGKHTLLTN